MFFLIDIRSQDPECSRRQNEEKPDMNIAAEAEVVNVPEVVHFQDYDSTKPLTFLMAEDGLVIVETGNLACHQNQIIVGEQEHYQVT